MTHTKIPSSTPTASEKLQSQLTCQGFIFSFLLEHSMKSINSLWSSAQSKLPKNIFNFSIRCRNSTQPIMQTFSNVSSLYLLTAHFASALSLFFTLSLAASHILKRAVILGGTTQHYTMCEKFLPTCFLKLWLYGRRLRIRGVI